VLPRRDGVVFSKKLNPATKQIESELPHESSSIQDARTLFDQIVSHFNRNVLKIMFAERRYKGPLNNGVPVHFILDLGVDRGNGVLELIDYKTGWITSTVEEMYDSDQVLMNLLGVTLDPEFKDYTTKQFTYFWLRKGVETGPVSFDAERLKDYEHWLQIEYKRILDIQQPSETLNRFCASCGRRTECKKYRDWITEALNLSVTLTPEQMANTDYDALMAQHEKLSGQIKKLEDYKDGIKDFLEGQLKVLQQPEIEGSTFKCGMRGRTQEAYSVQSVVALCNEYKVDPSSVFTVKAKAVEEMFASNQQAMQTLNLTRKRFSTAPYLAVSQAAGAKRPKTPRKKKEKVEAAPAAPGTEPVYQTAPGAPPMTITPPPM
jgi:hypothetical protein